MTTTEKRSRFKTTKPVRERFMKGASWQQVLIALGVWLAIALLSLGVSVAITFIFSNPGLWPAPFGFTFVLLTLLLLSVPLLGAGITAINVRRSASAQALDLLRLTNARPAAVVWGSFVAGLYRLRYALAIIWALPTLPLMLTSVRWAYVSFPVEAAWRSLFPSMLITLAILAMLIIFSLGPLALSVSLGIGIALRTRGDWGELGAVLMLGLLFFSLIVLVGLVPFSWLLVLFPQMCAAYVPAYALVTGVFLVIAENWVWVSDAAS